MDIAFINSRQDPAGRNIREHLHMLLEEEKIWPLAERHTLRFFEVDERLIYQERIDAAVGADLIVFISRHSSRHPVPALTVHVTGNFGSADLGGEARALAPAAPDWMHALLRNLQQNAPDGYRVSYEVTHHGPTDLSTPSLFIEIGSTHTEWTDPAAGEAVAASILSAEPGETIPLIGFGGTHYAVRQTEIALRSRAAFGHIAPSREVPLLDLEMIRAMAEQSRAVAAYIDKKAVAKAEEAALDDLLARAGVPRLTEGEILEIGALGWDMYRRIRRLAEEILPGSRIHIHTLRGEGTAVAVSAARDLIEEVLKSHKTEFIDSISKMPVVHLSKGSEEVAPTFITYESEATRLANDLTTLCVKLLLISESTVVDGDRLLIQKARFDPDKARRLGVPPGPLFGKLAGGREIEIEGQQITPAMVQTISERIIHLPGLERHL